VTPTQQEHCSCPNLEFLSISGSNKYTAIALAELVGSCKRLRALHLDGVVMRDGVKRDALRICLVETGAWERIEELSIRRCSPESLRASMASPLLPLLRHPVEDPGSMAAYISLRKLDATAYGSDIHSKPLAFMPIALQIMSPNLEELLLDGVGGEKGFQLTGPKIDPRGRDAGWPKLRVCQLSAVKTESNTGVHAGATYVTDEWLDVLLGSSELLKELHVAGCHKLTPNMLRILRTKQIVSLDVSGMNLTLNFDLVPRSNPFSCVYRRCTGW